MVELFKFKFGDDANPRERRWLEGAVTPQADENTYKLTAHLYFRPTNMEGVLMCNQVSLVVDRPFSGEDFWALVLPMSSEYFNVNKGKFEFECEPEVRCTLGRELEQSVVQCLRQQLSPPPDIKGMLKEIQQQLANVRRRELLHAAFINLRRR